MKVTPFSALDGKRQAALPELHRKNLSNPTPDKPVFFDTDENIFQFRAIVRQSDTFQGKS